MCPRPPEWSLKAVGWSFIGQAAPPSKQESFHSTRGFYLCAHQVLINRGILKCTSPLHIATRTPTIVVTTICTRRAQPDVTASLRLVWPRIAPSDLLKETLHVVLLPRPLLGQISPRILTARFSKVFATVLQTPESFSRHLQHRCKHQKVFRGTCNTVANTKKFFAAFATPLQAPKSFSWHLQHRCKHQKVFRGTCNTVANVFFSENQALYKEPCPRSVINPFLS